MGGKVGLCSLPVKQIDVRSRGSTIQQKLGLEEEEMGMQQVESKEIASVRRLVVAGGRMLCHWEWCRREGWGIKEGQEQMCLVGRET